MIKVIQQVLMLAGLLSIFYFAAQIAGGKIKPDGYQLLTMKERAAAEKQAWFCKNPVNGFFNDAETCRMWVTELKMTDTPMAPELKKAVEKEMQRAKAMAEKMANGGPNADPY
jgi:hypothetical protein